LPDGARHGDAADGQEVLQGEVQPNAEHEQDDADFGELWRKRLISDKAGRERSDHDTSHKIADKRREPQTVGDHAADERKPEANDDGGDQGCVMRHVSSLAGAVGVLNLKMTGAISTNMVEHLSLATQSLSRWRFL
jgi:hypothetical protein